MVGTTRTLRRQNATLLEQADQLGVLLEREQETVAELRELDRLKSDFAAAASHELRTPLTTIRGYAEMLKERAHAVDPGTRDAVEAIVRQTAHLQRLVGNLLREAQLEHGDPEITPEPTSVVDVLDQVRAAFPGAVDRIDLGRARPAVAGVGPGRAARDRGQPGGQRPQVLDAGRSRRRGCQDRRRLADDPGQRRRRRDLARDLPRIFDRVTQIDQSSTRAHGGVGLGLHLVRELTRRFGGEVAVESVVDRGTTFTITIPLPASVPQGPQHSEMTPA